MTEEPNDEENLIEETSVEAVAADDFDEDELDEEEETAEAIAIFDADREDAEEVNAAAAAAYAANLQQASTQQADDANDGDAQAAEEIVDGDGAGVVRDMAELMSIVEALIFVSEEPLSAKAIAEVVKEDRAWIEMATEELAKEFNERGGGLMLREVANGWQFATRPEHHEQVRAYLKSRPSAKLSLAALETLAVIAYKQPITVPEILEIRGVQSSSAISTLLNKRLIVPKGRKETIGRPIMYGTSKDFLLQFGLKDLAELPSIEDFEDLTGVST